MSGGSSDSSAEIRTFLIADVRGYTLFTQQRGDEAAAKLAKKFAEVAREGVKGRGGRVIELRGDEALAVFGSPRQAIRAAVELQDRFVEETISDPSLPLMVAIGLDAGEAVPVEGGYRGGPLNLAARLCGQAGPGEILASQEVAHFARRVEGVRFQDGGDLVLKGLAQPVRVIRVSSEREDAVVRLAPYAPPKVPEHAAPERAGFPRSLLRGRGLVALLVPSRWSPQPSPCRCCSPVEASPRPRSSARIPSASSTWTADRSSPRWTSGRDRCPSRWATDRRG